MHEGQTPSQLDFLNIYTTIENSKIGPTKLHIIAHIYIDKLRERWLALVWERLYIREW
jgi:hypothetical protein